MGRLREWSLNGLLAAMVILSVLLSYQVWFPSNRIRLTDAGEPRIQVPPPSGSSAMPAIFRPERLYVQQKGGRVALIQAGTDFYQSLWSNTHNLLSSIRTVSGPTSTPDFDPTESDGILVVLPIALGLGDWADQWGWNPTGLRSAHLRIDRVLFVGGQSPGLYVTGPTGDYHRLTPFSPAEGRQLQTLMAGVNPAMLVKYRPLSAPDAPVRMAVGLRVPEASGMPDAVVHLERAFEKAEEARYFPDLSVVRQIDERDAKSYTDGQRLLRLSHSGILEYRTAQGLGSAPDLDRALGLAQDWVGLHSGWPDGLILSQYTQESTKGRLLFEVRSPGPYPVESSGGAVQVDVSVGRPGVGGRVIMFRRVPNLKVTFGEVQRPISSPEQALQAGFEDSPDAFQHDLVREIHLAYQLQSRGTTGTGWVLEPVWVIQVGETRLYVLAEEKKERRQLTQP